MDDEKTNGRLSSDAELTTAKAEEQAYRTFSTFSTKQWVRWINSFLNEEIREPVVLVGREEPHHVLARIYSSLDKKPERDRFAEAVARILESTPPLLSNAKYLYYLIDLISFVRPLRGKRLLRRYLRERRFANISFGLQNLHTMLLVAASKYDVDQGLLKIIRESRSEIKDYTYSLVCLRVLSLRGEKEYLDFLPELLRLLDSKANAAKLARQLKGIFLRDGYREFCTWYSEAAQNVAEEYLNQFEFFEEGLKNIVFSDFNAKNIVSSDPHRALIAAQLHAYDHRFTADELLALGQLHRFAEEETTIDALVNVWRRNVPIASEGKPWWYLTALPDSAWLRQGGQPDLALIITDHNSPHEVTAHFNTKENSSLAYILERAKSICDSHVAFRTVAATDSVGRIVTAQAVPAESLSPALAMIPQDPEFPT